MTKEEVQMMPHAEELTREYVRRFPESHRFICPKSYRYDGNEYHSPKSLIVWAVQLMEDILSGRCNDKTWAQTNVIMARVMGFQASAGAPTFFVTRHFLSAIQQTDPPDDLKLGDVPWALPTLNFVLPKRAIVLGGWGGDTCMITISHIRKGDEYKLGIEKYMLDLDPRTKDDPKSMEIVTSYDKTVADADMTCFMLMHSPSEIEIISRKTEVLMNTTYKDLISKTPADIYDCDGTPEGANTQDRWKALMSLCVRLLLGMNAEPEFVTKESLADPGKRKGDKIIAPETWNPSYLSFPVQAINAMGLGGGNSYDVRWHWRKGHFRHYVQGEGKRWKKTQTVWLKPQLIKREDAPEHVQKFAEQMEK